MSLTLKSRNKIACPACGMEYAASIPENIGQTELNQCGNCDNYFSVTHVVADAFEIKNAPNPYGE